jgi:hypothetical protein
MNKRIYELIERVRARNTVKEIDCDPAAMVPTEWSNGLNNLIGASVETLKDMLRRCGIKVSGRKSELIARIVAFSIIQRKCVKLQSMFRMWQIHRVHKWFNQYESRRSQCVNDTDFYNLDRLVDIPKFKFITITDGSGLYYGCSIQSLHHLASVTPVLNPYNRMAISQTLLDQVRVIYKTPHIRRVIIPVVEPLGNLSMEETFKLRVVNVFQQINMLGHYSDPSWFLSLSLLDTSLFFKHLRDIWRYRANPSDRVRREICPMGDPFMSTIEDSHWDDLPVDIYLKTKVVQTIELMVQSGVNVDSRTLGSYYVLSALTLVSTQAAIAFPWLYQSLQEDNML